MFSDEMDIPPIYNKILNKLQQHGQLEENEFKLLLFNLRINEEDYKEIYEYLIKNNLIQRIPKLSVERNGGTHDVILPTRKFL